MISLIAGLLFVGYLLVYAAVEKAGEFASHPWDAIFPQGQTPAASVKQSVGGGKVGRSRPGG